MEDMALPTNASSVNKFHMFAESNHLFVSMEKISREQRDVNHVHVPRWIMNVILAMHVLLGPIVNALYKQQIWKNGKNLFRNAKRNRAVNMAIMKFRRVIVKFQEISALQAHNFHLNYINAIQVVT